MLSLSYLQEFEEPLGCYLIFMLSLSYLQECEEPLGCYLIFMLSLSYLQEFEEPLGCYLIFMLSLSYLQEFEEPLGCYLIFMLSVLSPGVWGTTGLLSYLYVICLISRSLRSRWVRSANKKPGSSSSFTFLTQNPPSQSRSVTSFINPLHAKFCRENINMYLHFMSLRHIDMTQVLKILPHVRPRPTYATWSISWLLMSWRRKEPGHQQPWYWPS